MTGDPEGDLVVLATAENEVEAASLVAALRDEGIPVAVNILPARRGGGFIPLSRRPVALLVRPEDLETARSSIGQAGDVNWDEVDVGQRTDDLPLSPGGMPLLARIAFVVAVIAALTMIVAFVVIMRTPAVP